MEPFNKGQESISQAEHISPLKTGDNIEAKRVVSYVWNSSTLEWERMTQPGGSSSSGKATDAYGIQAISETATFKYFFFENATPDWYILRKTLATGVFAYAKGTGSYTTVYVDSTSGPSGSPTFDTYGATF